MKAPTRAVVVGFTLANLYLLSLTGPLVSPLHELVFHLPGSATPIFCAVALDIVLAWAAISVALWLVRRHPNAELLLWSALLLALPGGLIATAYGFNNKPVPPTLRWSVAVTSLLAFAGFNILCRSSRRWPRVRDGIALSLVFLALPELLLLVQMFWYGWQSRNLNAAFKPAPAHARPADPQPVHPTRILWIILDELAFDQVYGSRYPGLILPNFDRLAAQSAVFTHAIPAAEYTRIAMPSMFTGDALRRAQPSPNGRSITMVLSQTGQHVLFQAQDTVFGDAQRAGLETSVAGWYEPYCRMLPGVLNRCFWTYSDDLPGGITRQGGFLQHVLEPFQHFFHLVVSSMGRGQGKPTSDVLDVRRHFADYAALTTAGEDLLRSGQPGLIFLHMPIPHPWGFYDRRTDTFPEHRTSYIDNLALADRYLGEVHSELEAEGLWDETNVLVMGDHSWRTSHVWADSAHWTAEEQAASHEGAFDDRPAVILKLSGERAGTTINARFDTVRIRALLDALMKNRLPTAAALQQWVAQGRLPAMSPQDASAVRPWQAR